MNAEVGGFEAILVYIAVSFLKITNKWTNWGWGYVSVIECLLSVCKAMDSLFSTKIPGDYGKSEDQMLKVVSWTFKQMLASSLDIARQGTNVKVKVQSTKV